MAGKAWLLFQKYLEVNCYIHVPCITDEQRDQLREKIQKAITAVEEDKEPEDLTTVFNEVIEEIEPKLKKQLLKPFLKSYFYKEFQVRGLLNRELPSP